MQLLAGVFFSNTHEKSKKARANLPVILHLLCTDILDKIATFESKALYGSNIKSAPGWADRAA